MYQIALIFVVRSVFFKGLFQNYMVKIWQHKLLSKDYRISLVVVNDGKHLLSRSKKCEL